MHIVLLNYVYDAEFATADALLERYLSLTGWAESVLAAGADRVTVLQRFDRNIAFCRNGVAYRLCADGGPRARPWMYPRRMHRAVAALRPDIAHINGLHFSLQTWLLRRALPYTSALLVQDHGSVPPPTYSPLPGDGSVPPTTFS